MSIIPNGNNFTRFKNNIAIGKINVNSSSHSIIGATVQGIDELSTTYTANINTNINPKLSLAGNSNTTCTPTVTAIGISSTSQNDQDSDVAEMKDLIGEMARPITPNSNTNINTNTNTNNNEKKIKQLKGVRFSNDCKIGNNNINTNDKIFQTSPEWKTTNLQLSQLSQLSQSPKQIISASPSKTLSIKKRFKIPFTLPSKNVPLSNIMQEENLFVKIGIIMDSFLTDYASFQVNVSDKMLKMMKKLMMKVNEIQLEYKNSFIIDNVDIDIDINGNDNDNDDELDMQEYNRGPPSEDTESWTILFCIFDEPAKQVMKSLNRSFGKFTETPVK